MSISTEKKHVKKGKTDPVFNTETMLPISEIRGSTMILKDGGLRAVIKVSGINIDLKNYDEQVQVIEQYKRFLNGLDFPIQILIRNNYLELTDYIEYMHENVNLIAQRALQEQGKGYIAFLNNINSQQGLVFVKEFYVIVPYYQFEQDTVNVRKPRRQKFLNAFSTQETPERIVERYRNFIKYDKYLTTRVGVVIEGLRGVGLLGERLDTQDLITLMFREYNPEAHKNLAPFPSL